MDGISPSSSIVCIIAIVWEVAAITPIASGDFAEEADWTTLRGEEIRSTPA
jgi:hypothetical protein